MTMPACRPAPSFSPPQLAKLRRRLLQWYDGNRRDLPWRKTRDPYRIWISEVMLQQTRVQAVIPYYERFLRTFPNVRRLAAAPEERLLACWSGLGYYSRARNLQKAAQVIVREHGGVFPRALDAALSLPGVGRYTASAVLSIAYGKPLAVLDGNVARVLARLYAIRIDVRSTQGRETLCRKASELLSHRRPGDFNQAVMELGATVCVPLQPRCSQCPLRQDCLAYLRREVERYPLRRAKPLALRHAYTAAVVLDEHGRLLLVQRSQESQWMKGFWEFPMWEPARECPPPGLVLGERLGSVRHSITDHRLEIVVHSAALRNGKPLAAKWVRVDELEHQPVTTMTRKALRFLAALS